MLTHSTTDFPVSYAAVFRRCGMKSSLLRFVKLSGLTLVILSVFSGAAIFAQDTTSHSGSTSTQMIQYVYFHGALGVGFDVYKSSDIEAMVAEELNIKSLGFPFQYGFRTGFRNIVQIEYSKSSTDAHNIGSGAFTGSGSIVTTSVPMKLKSSEFLFKVNPAVWNWFKPSKDVRGVSRCLFLILGNSDTEYRDNVGDGFDGSGKLYGLEIAGMNRYVSFSFGATYQTITYETTRLFSIDIPYQTKASRFLMYMRMGLGFGV